jgi:hypothetical protein
MIQEKYETIVKEAYKSLNREYPEEMIPVLGGGFNKPYMVPASSRELSCSFTASSSGGYTSWSMTWDKVSFEIPSAVSTYKEYAFVIRNPEAPITIDMAARMLESWCESFSGIKPE